MDFQEVGSEGMDWIYLAGDGLRVAGACECFFELWGSITCGKFVD
jgi:hypothetical protein